MLILISSFTLVHCFACIFYMQARAKGFTPDTWVSQSFSVDEGYFKSWAYSMYWAAQTLTTVGYGDFGCYNSFEIFITCVWMFIGVAIYSVVVGTLTSAISSVNSENENLHTKLKALEEYSQEHQLNQDLHFQVKSFMINNQKELFGKVDEEELINELPGSIKEELLYF